MSRPVLDDATIRETGSIRDAMVALDAGHEIALIVDASHKLVGIMTDGDVRRALLRGATLDTPVSSHMVRTFQSAGRRAPRIEVLERMQALAISQVPVVDDDGRLVGLHLLRELIGTPPRPNWAVIMAGGRGSRLAPLTDEVPKPMLRVAGSPILERIVLHVVNQGVTRIFLAVNYLGHIIKDHFGDGSRFGAHIEYLSEDKPLGTGGALSLLPEAPTAPVLVMNGDLVTQADLGALLRFHDRGPQIATVAIRKYFHTVPFGCVELDGERLVKLQEKPTLTQLVNAGIYVLAPQLVTALPRNQPTTVPDILSSAMNRGDEVRAFEIDDDWIDVGHRDQLDQARGGS